MIYAIDFDGTCVTHQYPAMGKDIGAAPVLRAMVKAGHRLILNTMRSNLPEAVSRDLPKGIIPVKAGNYLDDATNWFEKNGIKLYGVNVNPEQASWTSSPKVLADVYIDDAGLGMPLRRDHTISNRPFVDWVMVAQMLNINPLPYPKGDLNVEGTQTGRWPAESLDAPDLLPDHMG